MEFIDNGATYDTSLVSKKTTSIVLKTQTSLYMHKRRIESYCSPEEESSFNL
jgi:hypothetical protein